VRFLMTWERVRKTALGIGAGVDAPQLGTSGRRRGKAGQGSRRLVRHLGRAHRLLEVLPALRQQLEWLLGASGDADVGEKLKQFTLDGYAQQFSVPVYVLHGTDDVIMDLAGARRFVSALTVDNVTFEVYDVSGSLQGSYDYAAHAVSALADWFADRPGVGGASFPVV
jgi:alpha-beta hydrolase superfamily lysophospholipase